MKKIITLFTVACSSALLSVFLFSQWKAQSSPATPLQNTPPIKRVNYTFANSAESAPTDFVSAAERSIDAVVHVKNTATDDSSRSYFDFFYGRQDGGKRIGTGSGVIVSPDGYIITNNHVIEDATLIEVTMNNNKRYPAELVGTDPFTDIAVLKIDAVDLPYLYFADSDQTKIGQWVLAIGNPFNLNSTVTAGIISAKSRDLNKNDQKNQSFIQTDAAVNMGNSGGALVNTRGELIGINTAISTLSGGFEGYSFAVPSNIAQKVFEDLVEYGSIQKGLLGIRGGAITPEFIAQENLTETEGVYISSISKGMGADLAGLKTGDVIQAVDGKKIREFSDLTGYLESKRPGDKVEVTYSRDGRVKTANVLLKKLNIGYLGDMSMENLSEKELKEMSLDHGVRVIDSGRYLSRRIEAGNIITQINDTPIHSIEDVNAIELRDIEFLEYRNNQGEIRQLVFGY